MAPPRHRNRLAAERALEQGATAHQVARRYGIHIVTARKWRLELKRGRSGRHFQATGRTATTAENRVPDEAAATAPELNGSAGGEAPEAVVTELFGAPPQPQGQAPPGPGASPLADPPHPFALPVTEEELVGMGELVVGTVDSALAGMFGGPPAQGMSKGQIGFLKVFHQRITAALKEVADLSTMSPTKVLAITLAVLIVPRGVQRVGGYVRRRREARGAVPGRAENGQNGGGAAVVQGSNEAPPVPAAGH